MAPPDVSVLMSVHNGARYVRQAIGSILSQTGPAFEFIVVDDGSDDETPSILQEHGDDRLVIVRNESNLGLTQSLNVGLGKARGTYVARMDVDDVSLPGRLEAQVDELNRSTADVCFCRCLLVDDEKGREREWREPERTLIRWRALFDNAYGPHPAAMFRRQAIMKLGGYDERFRWAQDYDLWDRCAANGLAFVHVPKVLLRYLTHSESITRSKSLEQSEAARSISFRAMARAFPDASDDELASLRWLILGRPERPDDASIEGALRNFFRRAECYSSPPVWKDVAASLSRRLKDVNGVRRAQTVRRMMEASLRSLSPASMARSAYSALLPGKV